MTLRMSDTLFPTLYIPHGAGPCFFMDWTLGPANTWDKTEHWLANIHENLPSKPKAIVCISAHWENDAIKINSHPNPALYFDYYGFPSHTYELTYPAPGSPKLAESIQTLLAEAGINSELDDEHGFDHGTFVPLKVMFPKADIPVVQISLQRNLDPTFHIKMGNALQSLRKQGILILGSGISFHNMDILMRGKDTDNHSGTFNQWLNDACESPVEQRNTALSEWANAPSARQCHPREEHLLPLMVVAGSAGNDLGKNVFTDRVMGVTVSAYQFG